MPNELQPGINTGVIVAPPSLGAWVDGGETGIVKEILEESGQFDLYLPDNEAQSRPSPYYIDTSACVTFSGTNNLETLIQRLRVKGLLPATHENFLLSSKIINPLTGRPNLSDRFSAKLNGTTKAGALMEIVGAGFRRDGVVAESDWPFPSFEDLPGDANRDARFARYYAEIPSELKDKGKKFLDYFEINHEWIITGTTDNNRLRDKLKYGPIQVATEVCSPWSGQDDAPPIPKCGCTVGHATLIHGYRSDLALKDLDHYQSFRKLLAADYCIPWGMQYTLKVKQLAPPPVFHYTFTKQLRYRSTSNNAAEVNALQKALQTLRRADGFTYMKVGVFGPFGPATKAALGLFQLDNGIFDPDGAGTNFGPQGRAAMNQKLNA